jgi:pimeloyl-ACP methyl ester carboxylesterase
VNPRVPLVVLVAITGCGNDHAPSVSFRDHLAQLHTTACDTSPVFQCGTIEVPVDHADPSGPRQPFTFAARPADGDSLGVLLSIDGGPGYSGVDDADDWTTTDPAIETRFDLLTFDLRGVSRSTLLDCPTASSAWYTGGLRGATAAEQHTLVARAQAYATDCPTEAGFDATTLGHYTTAQAAEDIDALRGAFELADMTVYGLSYGTQLAQTYATAHPDRVRALVLDGVIDLTDTENDFATSLDDAVVGILDRVLAS